MLLDDRLIPFHKGTLEVASRAVSPIQGERVSKLCGGLIV